MRNRDRVIERSGSRCEAMVAVGRTWTRCWKDPVEVHHRLTRGRGGALLDELGEIYHLIALCSDHHRDADGAEAYIGGLLIDGMMCRNGDRVFYVGTDPYLSARYA